MDREDKKIFLNTPLIASLSKDAQEKALNTFEIVNIKKGQCLFHDDDHTKNTYILLQGTLKVSTSHHLSEDNIDFGAINEGEIVGEQVLFSDADRSATITATKNCKLAMISRNDFKNLIEDTTKTPFFPMLLGIKKIRDKRISITNNRLTAGLKKEIELLKEQKNIIGFFISMVVALCIYSFLTDTIYYFTITKKLPEITSIILIILLSSLALWYAKKAGLSLKDQGFTLVKWKIITFDAILYTVPILLLMTLLKFLIITYSPYYHSLPLFDFSNIDISLTLFYVILSVPIQEYISRGILQGSLQSFLETNNPWIPIIVSNIIFGTFHLGYGEEVASVVLISGLYFGWLYHRQRSLLGVWIAHSLIGLWCIDIINLKSLF